MSRYDELRRGSYHPDAASKAAEQEAYDQAGEDYVAHQRAAEQALWSDGVAHDRADHTVLRRSSERRDDAPMGGGAVISRRSGLSSLMSRRARSSARRSADAGYRTERQMARERRAWERDQRRHAHGGGGPMRPLLVVLAVLVGLYLVFCLPIDRAISFSQDEREGLSSELSLHVPVTPYYVLALGSDAREGDAVSRSDTMILVRVDLVGGKLTMLSIPRDTKVEIEGYGTQKINAAYAFGGVAGAVSAAHDLTGAPISQAALIRFDGVESLVDYLGGITVDVPVPVYDPEYTGLIMDVGVHEMDGRTALLFSRVRHGFDLGDYQRQKDQRLVIEAIMRKILALPPWELPGVVKHMGGLVGTSMRMYSILPLMLRLKLAGEVTMYQATVPSTTAMIDGVSYVVADDAELAQMMDVIDSGGDPATLL